MTDMMLTQAETDDLRALAGMIVPASATYKVPGADDDMIFADILKSLGRDRDDVRAALAQAGAKVGGSVAALDAAGRDKLATRLQADGGPQMAVLTRVVLLCYYRDDRVMISLGLEPRAPFPKGHVLEQGDWSLLDPVKARKPFWRQVPS
ncbi:MAG: hypothetical protein NT133_12910 [Alphaproteobacteria bacterium]|nr:hypothetical protein [Alphaproteobacteria bacterium]